MTEGVLTPAQGVISGQLIQKPNEGSYNYIFESFRGHSRQLTGENQRP